MVRRGTEMSMISGETTQIRVIQDDESEAATEMQRIDGFSASVVSGNNHRGTTYEPLS